MRLIVKLKNNRTGQETRMRARQPNILDGIWVVNEQARRRAFARIGADWQDTNPGVTSSATIRAVDANGWHTFTIYPAD